jgi:hypothetical protein
MINEKKWFLSKSIWVNILMGVAMIAASFSPSASEFIREYFAETGAAWGLVNVLLRVITKKELTA